MRRFDFIAIGCSAGGFEALGRILPGLPTDFPIPVAVAIHMPPDKDSLLAGTLGGKCRLPVKEAEDKEPFEPGCIYVAPPNYHLLVDPEMVFSLSVEPPVNFSRPSIDVLFESGAFVFGPAFCAILLTGANSDGAKGLQAVLAGGGTGIVEDPATAQFPQMPMAAISLARPTHVLPLAGIGEWLKELERRR